ncbi:hypothetical protein FA95DRAFT_1155048 [Auriscalpium vulgare]|uniref:Uncharacterized protein n=1 Tax=Auriscalpium vulgare TaxID=40419 RepID=A0ACB8RVR4_9AGAM|nr:hypothetical protein FA95DRAFT_1155048 [Auriscalpium vulgare]
MSSPDPPQLQLSLSSSTPTFKRSFDQFGFDLESPVESNAATTSTSSDPGPSHSDRNKRQRSNLASPDSSSFPDSLGNAGSSSQHATVASTSASSSASERPPSPIADITPHTLAPPQLPSTTFRPTSEFNEQFRLSMERFNAFDSQISSLRPRPPSPPRRSLATSPPSLPPLSLPSPVSVTARTPPLPFIELSRSPSRNTSPLDGLPRLRRSNMEPPSPEPLPALSPVTDWPISVADDLDRRLNPRSHPPDSFQAWRHAMTRPMPHVSRSDSSRRPNARSQSPLLSMEDLPQQWRDPSLHSPPDPSRTDANEIRLRLRREMLERRSQIQDIRRPSGETIDEADGMAGPYADTDLYETIRSLQSSHARRQHGRGDTHTIGTDQTTRSISPVRTPLDRERPRTEDRNLPYLLFRDSSPLSLPDVDEFFLHSGSDLVGRDGLSRGDGRPLPGVSDIMSSNGTLTSRRLASGRSRRPVPQDPIEGQSLLSALFSSLTS